ncbi:MAG TPA: bifunctional nuclease domain-containing protein [Candidatus Binatia bacterium]|nr:bifunctional nuclease domain-containing protein [Candidatus Binatia bacterium]
MKPRRWPFLLWLLLLLPANFYGAQEIPAVETKIKTLMLDPHTQTPIIVLETVTDKKLLPIWIDVPEARAIALELEHIATPRPLTHDLIRNILQGLGATLQRVTITDLRNNTYFAVLVLASKGQDLEVDARPSDAIAVALRMKAPIYASTQVLAKSESLPAPSTPTRELQKRAGFQAQDLTAELAALLDIPIQRGVLVVDVARGSTAMNAGMQRGDVITKANDRAVQSAHELEALVQSTKSETRIKLEVMRKGKPIVIVIDLPS